MDTPTAESPATYVIRVQGVLDAAWSGRLGGLRITAVDEGVHAATELSGELGNQTALLTVLGCLYDLGLPLLLLRRVVLHHSPPAAPGHAQSADRGPADGWPSVPRGRANSGRIDRRGVVAWGGRCRERRCRQRSSS